MTFAQISWDEEGRDACITLDRPVMIKDGEETKLRREIGRIHGISGVEVYGRRLLIRVTTNLYQQSVVAAMFTLCQRGYLEPVRWHG